MPGYAPDDENTIVYLSKGDVARILEVEPNTLNRYNLPAPAARIGNSPGWLLPQIETFKAQRKGPGNWKDKTARATAG